NTYHKPPATPHTISSSFISAKSPSCTQSHTRTLASHLIEIPVNQRTRRPQIRCAVVQWPSSAENSFVHCCTPSIGVVPLSFTQLVLIEARKEVRSIFEAAPQPSCRVIQFSSAIDLLVPAGASRVIKIISQKLRPADRRAPGRERLETGQIQACTRRNGTHSHTYTRSPPPKLAYTDSSSRTKRSTYTTRTKKKLAMPRPALPPTPGSSSDIRGKDGVQQLSALQLAFELPPPAIHDASSSSSSSSPVDPKLSPLSSANRPPSSAATSGLAGLDVAPSPRTVVYPMQAAETVKSRRRSSAATTTKESSSKANTTTSSSSTFALPPPPTRSRKIIQMKPRTTAAGANSASTTTTTKESFGRANIAGRASAAAKTAAPDAAGSGPGGASAKGGDTPSNNSNKKKQPSATSAAGRKIARKTAHSLIERRRRSK
ncbi:hypothetical protein BBK36DRAFT_1043879, partial [Trichoderma citrinoviride]